MSMEVTNSYGNYAGGRINEGSVSSEKQITQEYLNGLEQKYGVHITVGKSTTAKSFMNYMLGSSGGNNVYIESNIASKMASDPAYAEKYEKLIAKVPEEGRQSQKYIEADGNTKMLACGMQIHGDGKVTYWGVALNTGPKVRMGTELREKAEKKLAKQREVNKKRTEQWEKLQERRASQAETREELLEKLKNNNHEGITAGKEGGRGMQIDITL